MACLIRLDQLCHECGRFVVIDTIFLFNTSLLLLALCVELSPPPVIVDEVNNDCRPGVSLAEDERSVIGG